jgi:solute carrier family 25 (mitochondrial folate transporter), member 32
VYERAKAAFLVGTGAEQHVLSAITAGAITDVVTNPFWVVRTRMQTQVRIHTTQHYISPVYANSKFAVVIVKTLDIAYK